METGQGGPAGKPLPQKLVVKVSDEFDNAVVALDRGDATLNLDFQQKFAKGGKTVQELVEYMNSKGLKFAPATPGDERAYQALQTALAAHSLSVYGQVSSAATKE